MMTNEQLAETVARYGVGRAIPVTMEAVQEMASIIAQLWDKLQKLEAEFQAKDRAFVIASNQAMSNGAAYQQQREVMQLARELVQLIKDTGSETFADKAIAALDAALKGSE